MDTNKDNQIFAIEVLLSKGSRAYEDGDLKAAKSFFQRAAHANPKSETAALMLGKIAIDQGDPETAKQLFQVVLNSDSSNYDFLIEYGNSLQDLKDSVGSQRAWNDAIKQEPKRFEAYACLGAFLGSKNDYEAALASYEKGIKTSETLGGLLICSKGAGLCCLELMQFEKGKVHLDKCIEHCPDYGIFFYYRCKAFLGLGKTDLAINDATTAVSLEPDDEDFKSLRRSLL